MTWLTTLTALAWMTSVLTTAGWLSLLDKLSRQWAKNKTFGKTTAGRAER